MKPGDAAQHMLNSVLDARYIVYAAISNAYNNGDSCVVLAIHKKQFQLYESIISTLAMQINETLALLLAELHATVCG